MNTNTGIPKGSLCPDLLVVTLCRPSDQTFYSILSHLILFFSDVFQCEQSRTHPAACEEMGLLAGGGAKGPSRSRPVPKVPGIRIQLRKPAVRISII